MGRRIELPKLPAGEPKEQLQALYSYLYQMADALNNNLAEIGNGDYTDAEMEVVREIVGQDETGGVPEAESLKTLIIKTAQLIKSEIDAYNLKLIGTYEAEGKLGRYVRKTRLDVDVTPSGITQNYTFQDIIQGLKTYEVNAKNYIKTGYLRTENNIPIYGVAIGKDVVTFSSDGTETYNDGNKVAELTADELSFWQGGMKIAGYTGSRISFYYNSTEVMYLQNGKLYCNDDLTLATGKKLIINSTNFKMDENGDLEMGGVFKGYVGIEKDVSMMGATLKGILEFGEKRVEPSRVVGGYIVGNAFYDSPYDATTNPNFPKYPGLRMSYKEALHETGGYVDLCGVYGILKRNGSAQPANMYGFFPVEMSSVTWVSALGTEQWPWESGYIKYLESKYIITEALSQTSSREKKHDIEALESMGDKLDQLRPVSFIYNDDETGRRRMGLIHEEAIDVMPEICVGGRDDDAGAKGINYVDLVPVLLKEIQELRARVKALEEK